MGYSFYQGERDEGRTVLFLFYWIVVSSNSNHFTDDIELTFEGSDLTSRDLTILKLKVFIFRVCDPHCHSPGDDTSEWSLKTYVRKKGNSCFIVSRYYV